MGQDTKIAWATHTFNIAWGCARVSEGCLACYAEAWAKRTGHAVWGTDAPRRTFGDKHWREPLKWNRDAAALRRRVRVFSSSMADVFEDHPTIAAERRKLWELISLTPWLDWLLLTKRSHMIGESVPPGWLIEWPRNVWLGVTAENQTRYDERIGDLLAMPAPVRFLSVEPLVGPLRLDHPFGEIQWVIAGCESGPRRRSAPVELFRDVKADCDRLGAAFFMKQLDVEGTVTDHPPLFPPDLRVRDFPLVASASARRRIVWGPEGERLSCWTPGRFADDEDGVE